MTEIEKRSSRDPSIILCRIGYRRKHKIKPSYYTLPKSPTNEIVEVSQGAKRSEEDEAQKPVKIEKSIFVEYNAIKMANIDAVFMVTGHGEGIRNLTTSRPYTFCDLINRGGGYTEYLQWRLPLSKGYGVDYGNNLATSDVGTKCNLNIADMGRMELKRIDPESYPENFATFIKSRETGLDLVLGSVDYPIDLSKLYYLVNQCLKEGGNFICLISHLDHVPTLYLIHKLTTIFEKVAFFRPMACYGISTDRYIVCKKLLVRDTSSLRDIVTSGIDIEKSRKIDKHFYEWIVEKNEVLSKGISVNSINYDKALLIWNLPGNVDSKMHV
jgi:hypothetical protein